MNRDEKVKYLSLLIHKYRMARDNENEEPDNKKRGVLSNKAIAAYEDIIDQLYDMEDTKYTL